MASTPPPPLTRDYSPFTPGQPTKLELFVGREAEVQRLLDTIGASTKGRLGVVYMNGERGIGKSSTAFAVRQLAERQHNVVGVHVHLGGAATLEELARRVLDGILKKAQSHSWYEAIKGNFEGKVRKVGLLSATVEFAPKDDELKSVVRNFSTVLVELTEKIAKYKAGLLLILDDLNGLALAPDFANWLKSVIDELATSGTDVRLCFLFVGLEERRQAMIGNQPSLSRAFDLISIYPWGGVETRKFFETAFDTVGMKVDLDALTLMARFSGGLPMFAHEIGDAAFRTNREATITKQDAAGALLTAADVIGKKYVEPQVVSAVKSAKYRAILRKICTAGLHMDFDRSSVKKTLTQDEDKVFDNFLRKMRDLNVITKNADGGPGAYRFVSEMYRLYLYISTETTEADSPRPRRHNL
jgi:hypothetical protein